MVHLVDADLDRLGPGVGPLPQDGVVIEKFAFGHGIGVDDILEADGPFVPKGRGKEPDDVVVVPDAFDLVHGASWSFSGRAIIAAASIKGKLRG
jgi:hypothetical protein